MNQILHCDWLLELARWSFIIWLAPRAGKMNQILRCDWLPERARWSYLAPSGLPAASRKKNYPKSHIINPLLIELGRSRWLDIGLVLFFASLWTSTPSRSINTHKKNGQYSAILISHLVNNSFILIVRLWDL